MENYPIHKEKYYLTGETFHSFMRDRLAKDLKREKNGYKLTSLAMFIVAAVVLGVVYLGNNLSLRDDFVWAILPIAMVFLGIANLNKVRTAEKGLDNKIMRDYTTQNFAKYQISVKFYEDMLVYDKGDKKEELQYNAFRKFYEGEKYFAIYFQTGEIVIFNPNCKKDKIKEVFANYVKSVKE